MSDWEVENLPDRYVITWAAVIARAIDIFRGDMNKGELVPNISTPDQVRSFVETFKTVQKHGTKE